MDLIFNFQNSPYFLGALLVLLLLILVLKNPTKLFLKFLAKKIRACKLRRKKKNEKKAKEKAKAVKMKSEFIPKEIVKVIKVESNKEKFVYVFWQRVLFLILGIGVILGAYFKNLDFFESKFAALYDFVFSGTGHNNLTTIIVTLLISIALLVIIRLITLVEKRKSIIYKIVHYVLFSFVAAFGLIVLLESVKFLSLINSMIMGVVFVAFGLLIKRKK